MSTVCITSELVTMGLDAVQNDRNRQPTDEWFKMLDPDGIHVCKMSFPHRSWHATEDEVRGWWLCKMQGIETPVDVWIDCSVDLFNANTHEIDIEELDAAVNAGVLKEFRQRGEDEHE